MSRADRPVPRRVLMTADAVGGVWTYAVELARALGLHDVQVTLAVLGPPPSPDQRAEVARLAHVSLREHRGRLEWMDDPWDDVNAAGEWLLALEQEAAADIVHLNGYCHGGLPWSSPVAIVGHSCVRSWWRAVKGTEVPSSLARYTAEVRHGLQAADLVVAPSGSMLCVLQQEYGPLPRTAVISNGRSVTARPAAGKEPFILTAGRLWDEAKNVAALCDIAARLEWPVYAAGDRGADAPRDTVRRLGRLTGGALEGWMQRASIYVLPARYEPFGLSALEAAHAGCALVLGDIDSLREIWGRAALYVPPDDREGLHRTLCRVIERVDLRREMAARARARAAIFTPRKMAAEYLDAYAWLLEQPCHRTAIGASIERRSIEQPGTLSTAFPQSSTTAVVGRQSTRVTVQP